MNKPDILIKLNQMTDLLNDGHFVKTRINSANFYIAIMSFRFICDVKAVLVVFRLLYQSHRSQLGNSNRNKAVNLG